MNIMRSAIISAVFFIILLNEGIAQIEWSRCFGGTQDESTRCIIQTSDGGFMCAANTTSADGDVTGHHGNNDIWLIKLDDSGNTEWSKCFGGSDWDYCESIVQTKDDGYIFCGQTASTNGDVSGFHGFYDAWVVKTDAYGVIEWQKCIGGTDNEAGYSIIQTQNGDFIVTGFTGSNDGDFTGNHGGCGDVFAVKINSGGNLCWQKLYGGSMPDYGLHVIETYERNYVIAANSTSNDGDVSNHNYTDDYWLLKIDTLGSLLWENCFGGDWIDVPERIIQTQDSGYIVSGYTQSYDGDLTGIHSDNISDYWILKLNKSFSIEWQKCLGGSDYDYGNDIYVTHDNGYIVSGYVQSNDGDVSGNHGGSDAWIVKLDETGNIQWQSCFGGDSTDLLFSVSETVDNGYILAGWTNSTNGDVSGVHGTWDVWILKLGSETSLNDFQTKRIINVYPNPANDVINIETKMAVPATFTIYSAMGQKLYSAEITEQIATVRISGIRPQPVLYEIRNAGGETIRGNLIITE